MRPRSRCACGNVRSRFSNMCRACHAARMLEAARQYRVAADRGTCGACEAPLMNNNSLAGTRWLQCSRVNLCTWQVLCGTDEYAQILKDPR